MVERRKALEVGSGEHRSTAAGYRNRANEASMAGGSKQGEKPKGGAPEAAASLAPARTIPTVAERLEIIVGMMERLEWVRGKSAPLLAEQWGLAVNTVEQSAAEAHRRVVGDKDEAIRDITAGARKLFKEAVQNGDQRGATAIANLWADIAGAKAPTKQEIDTRISGSASPAEAARLVREAFGEKASKPAADETPALPEPSEG